MVLKREEKIYGRKNTTDIGIFRIQDKVYKFVHRRKNCVQKSEKRLNKKINDIK
jgi:hypothetical protein